MNRIHGECILHLLFFVLHLLTIPPFISSYSTFWSSECTPSSSNTSTAAFKRNLDLLLQSLSTTAVAASGFSNNTVGEAPDRVFGLGICWAGSDAATCRSCLAAAASNFSAQGSEPCAAAAIWYDGCLLRYSTEPFFAAVDTNWAWMVTADGYNATEPGRFNETVAELMWRLMSEAAAAPERFAVGKAGNRSFDWVYGALQCTGDLSTGDCYRCLNTYLSVLPVCCFAIRGASIYGKSCYLRYETYPFFNESLLQSPQRLNPPQVEGTKNISGTSIIIMVVAFGASTFFLILLIASVCLWRRRTALRITSTIRCSESRLYDFNSLAIATDNFSDTNKLGEGGFGVVYKGRLPDGEEIAVKRLVKFIGRGVESIQNEMMVLARLEHRNLVRLLGSCIQEQEKLLVYEYMPNKSLDAFIFANDPTKRKEIGWKRRFDIIKGISRGLQYLHEGSRIRVIHRDLKASNILLDENMNPKISDFGLARLFDNDRTHEATSNVAGTFGYMAPEYVRHGTFSTKSDVFSFGVLLLEIITGRRNASLGDSEFAFDLVLYLRQNWDEGKALGLEDPVLGEECPEEEVGRCIHVGLLCVQEDPRDRPSMEEVNLMLSSFSMAVPPLLRPVRTPDASWAAKTSTVSHLNTITD